MEVQKYVYITNQINCAKQLLIIWLVGGSSSMAKVPAWQAHEFNPSTHLQKKRKRKKNLANQE